MATRAAERWTFEDYFTWESGQPLRHEFINGEVFGMTGGTLRHSRVIVNLLATLAGQFRGGSCVLFQGDAKLHVEAAGNSYYPDAFVCCSSGAMQERGVATDATAIFEVLSPSTALYNRSGKFADYRRLVGLRHYVIIDPEALTIEAFELIERRWTLVELKDEALDLGAIGATLSLSELFVDIGERRLAIGTPGKPDLPPD